jgi:hypothetical protein
MTTTVNVTAGHKGAVVVFESTSEHTNEQGTVRRFSEDIHELLPSITRNFTVTEGVKVEVLEPDDVLT